MRTGNGHNVNPRSSRPKLRLGTGPGMVGEAVVSIAEDNVIKHRDAEKLSGLAQSACQRAIFSAWRAIA